jgi:3,4-dihydroxy 2-butanone 4-phosphate synthase/GTP cyclohydrolase II
MEFCQRHGIKMISVADLIRYRLQNERVVKRHAEGVLDTEYGRFKTIAYTSSVDPETHLALVQGEVRADKPVLVRMHAHCTYGDVFSSTACDCHAALAGSMERISAEGCGVIVYLHPSTPGLRYEKHGDKLTLQPHARGAMYPAGADGQRKLQHEAGIGAQILADLGLRKIRLLTNHPRKIVGLEAYGIDVVDQEPIVAEPGDFAVKQTGARRV